MAGQDWSSRIKRLMKSAVHPFGGRAANHRGSHEPSIETFPVRVVITGIEHSGTTLLSTLLKQDPRLDSGFECGFLLADSPKDFRNVHPWYEWMQEPVSVHQWGVSPEHMESICASESWEEAYGKLLRFSPVFDQSGNQQICDKTPRYLSSLDSILEKLPDCIPCIVIEKDVDSLWRSHKKRNSSLADFCRMYALYNNGLRRAITRHGARIHRVRYEALCQEVHARLQDVFSIIALPFHPEYATQRQENIYRYYRRQVEHAAPLSAEEDMALCRLRTEFADLHK